MGARKRGPKIDPFAQGLDPDQIERERRRARELRASQWWKRRLARGVCGYCGRRQAPHLLTMDHIVPLARGGRSTRGNVVPCCKGCNNRKKQLLPMEWEAYLQGFHRPEPAGGDGHESQDDEKPSS